MSDILFPKTDKGHTVRYLARRAAFLAATISLLLPDVPQRRSALTEFETDVANAAHTCRVISRQMANGTSELAEKALRQTAKVFERCKQDFARYAESELNGVSKTEFTKMSQIAGEIAFGIQGERFPTQLPGSGYNISSSTGMGIG